jgi:hypothetical protein
MRVNTCIHQTMILNNTSNNDIKLMVKFYPFFRLSGEVMSGEVFSGEVISGEVLSGSRF